MNVKCQKCGYEWVTKSKMIYIGCPNCRRTSKREEARIKKPKIKR